VLPGDFEAKAQGKEGSGIVVASGGGVYANSVVGKHVGFITNVKGEGSYAEYTCVNALEGVFPLPDQVEVADAASHFVNPYTAYGFLDTVRNRHSGKGRPGLVQTAAASQLGQMLVKLCKQEKMTLINVVRREEQAETLRALGAEHVIVSSEDGWEEKLKDLVKEHKIQIAFDAIAGEMSGKVCLMCYVRHVQVPTKLHNLLFVYLYQTSNN
jgi:NADPH:quinone reductase